MPPIFFCGAFGELIMKPSVRLLFVFPPLFFCGALGEVDDETVVSFRFSSSSTSLLRCFCGIRTHIIASCFTVMFPVPGN